MRKKVKYNLGGPVPEDTSLARNLLDQFGTQAVGALEQNANVVNTQEFDKMGAAVKRTKQVANLVKKAAGKKGAEALAKFNATGVGGKLAEVAGGKLGTFLSSGAGAATTAGLGLLGKKIQQWDQKDGNYSKAGAMGGGALQGAAIGSALGPLGMAAGAGIGAVVGAAQKEKFDAQARYQEVVDFANEGAAEASQRLAKRAILNTFPIDGMKEQVYAHGGEHDPQKKITKILASEAGPGYSEARLEKPEGRVLDISEYTDEQRAAYDKYQYENFPFSDFNIHEFVAKEYPDWKPASKDSKGYNRGEKIENPPGPLMSVPTAIIRDKAEYDRRAKALADSTKYHNATLAQIEMMGLKDQYGDDAYDIARTYREGPTHGSSWDLLTKQQAIKRGEDFASEKEQFAEPGLWARPQDKELIDRYRELGFKDDEILFHSSPDIVATDSRSGVEPGYSVAQRATHSYFDGTAMSPYYPPPRQAIRYAPEFEKLEPKGLPKNDLEKPSLKTTKLPEGPKLIREDEYYIDPMRARSAAGFRGGYQDGKYAIGVRRTYENPDGGRFARKELYDAEHIEINRQNALDPERFKASASFAHGGEHDPTKDITAASDNTRVAGLQPPVERLDEESRAILEYAQLPMFDPSNPPFPLPHSGRIEYSPFNVEDLLGFGHLFKAGAQAVAKHAYKINPFAQKSIPIDLNAWYRGIGKEGLEDLQKHGAIRSLNERMYPKPYWGSGDAAESVIRSYGDDGFVAVVKGEPMTGVGAFEAGNPFVQTTARPILKSNPNLTVHPIKPHWLKGHNPVPIRAYGGHTNNPDYLAEGGEMIQHAPGDLPKTDHNGSVTPITATLARINGDKHSAPSGGVGMEGDQSARIYSDQLHVSDELLAQLSRL